MKKQEVYNYLMNGGKMKKQFGGIANTMSGVNQGVNQLLTNQKANYMRMSPEEKAKLAGDYGRAKGADPMKDRKDFDNYYSSVADPTKDDLALTRINLNDPNAVSVVPQKDETPMQQKINMLSGMIRDAAATELKIDPREIGITGQIAGEVFNANPELTKKQAESMLPELIEKVRQHPAMRKHLQTGGEVIEEVPMFKYGGSFRYLQDSGIVIPEVKGTMLAEANVTANKVDPAVFINEDVATLKKQLLSAIPSAIKGRVEQNIDKKIGVFTQEKQKESVRASFEEVQQVVESAIAEITGSATRKGGVSTKPAKSNVSQQNKATRFELRDSLMSQVELNFPGNKKARELAEAYIPEASSLPKEEQIDYIMDKLLETFKSSAVPDIRQRGGSLSNKRANLIGHIKDQARKRQWGGRILNQVLEQVVDKNADWIERNYVDIVNRASRTAFEERMSKL